MADNSSLMAHLIPRLTIQVENAATDARGYIPNSSTQGMQVLNEVCLLCRGWSIAANSGWPSLL